MIVKTYQQGEKKVIRGHVQRATVVIYHGPTIAASGEIDRKDWPFQTNNMTAWFAAAYKVLGAPMRKMITKQTEIEYVVNDGDGAKTGHGSSSNKLSYLLREDGLLAERLDIMIETKPAAAVHQAKIAAGHIPRQKKDWSAVTHLDPRDKTVHKWQEDIGEFLVYPMEEFYEEFPEWRGKLPAKGIDDPDDVRAGRWTPMVANG